MNEFVAHMGDVLGYKLHLGQISETQKSQA